MQAFLEQCQSLIAGDARGIYASLLVAGLVSGATHCAGMCGPFVATQTATRLDAIPAAKMREWHRLQGAALAPYHLGRMLTYSLLGALAGSGSSFLFSGSASPLLSSLLLATAGILFMMQAFGAGVFSLQGTGIARIVAYVSKPLWRDPTGLRGLALGMALGLLPCSMVYAALLAAATTQHAMSGALAMAAFGLGTVPALFLVGLGSHFAARRWRTETRLAARSMLAGNGILLCVLAVRNMV